MARADSGYKRLYPDAGKAGVVATRFEHATSGVSAGSGRGLVSAREFGHRQPITS